MNMLCTQCGHPRTQHGVCVAIDEALHAHVKTLYDNRPTANLELSVADYDELPGILRHSDFLWRIRTADVKFVLDRLGNTPKDILEIGAWNGWLSHHIARANHNLTSLGYSQHPINGLGAMTHYSVNWHAIQTDISDLSQFADRSYDTVIVNHGLHYFTDPVLYVTTAKRLVKSGGRLLLLNVIVYRNPSQRINQLRDQQRAFEDQYHIPFFLKPTHGYLDTAHENAMRQLGIQFLPYRHLRHVNLKSHLIRTAPSYYQGIWQHNQHL